MRKSSWGKNLEGRFLIVARCDSYLISVLKTLLSLAESFIIAFTLHKIFSLVRQHDGAVISYDLSFKSLSIFVKN